MSVHASGNVKSLNIVNSLLLALSFPLSYIALKFGMEPTSIFGINAVCYALSCIVCLYYSHKYTQLPVFRILKDVYLNSLLGGLIMFIVPYLFSLRFISGWLGLLVVGSVSLLTSGFVIYFWGMTNGMRSMLLEKLKIKYQ